MNTLGLLVVIIIRFYVIESGEIIAARIWPEPSAAQCIVDMQELIRQPDPQGLRTTVECEDSDLGARLFGAKTI